LGCPLGEVDKPNLITGEEEGGKPIVFTLEREGGDCENGVHTVGLGGGGGGGGCRRLVYFSAMKRSEGLDRGVKRGKKKERLRRKEANPLFLRGSLLWQRERFPRPQGGKVVERNERALSRRGELFDNGP